MWREVFNDKKEVPFFLDADDCTEEHVIEPEKKQEKEKEQIKNITKEEALKKLLW